MDHKRNLIIDISGRVQGVGFRYHTCRKANALGLCGKVCNLPDGRVRVWLGGDATAVEQMIAWLRHGPDHARVEHIAIRPHAQPVEQRPFIIST